MKAFIDIHCDEYEVESLCAVPPTVPLACYEHKAREHRWPVRAPQA